MESSLSRQRGTPLTGMQLSGKNFTSVELTIGIEESRFDREPVQLGALLEAKLNPQPRTVGLHGFHAHADLIRDLLIRMPLRQQPEHLLLAPTQLRRLFAAAALPLTGRRAERLREIHERPAGM